MTDDSTVSPAGTTSADYGSAYYNDAHLGGVGDYGWESEHWRGFFTMVADRIIGVMSPRTVLDVGCAKGMLVQGLTARGVDAYGFDISEHAIETAHADVRDRLYVGSATEPIGRRYDLITCIEVLEHMAPEDAQKAIDVMTEASDRILFSSSPGDFDESTHINTNQTAQWAAWFAERGYYRRTDLDASFLVPWAIFFEKGDLAPRSIVHRYETRLGPLREEVDAKREALLAMHRENVRLKESGAQPSVDLNDADIQARHDALVARDNVMGLEAKLVVLRNQLEATRKRAQRLRETIEDRDAEIKSLRESRTWRVGRAVTGPLGRLKG